METTEITQILKVELQKRKERNSAFSLRAFARKLGISPAQLSQLLSGKRNFTPATISKISQALGLSEEMGQRLFAQAAMARYSNVPAEEQKRKLREDEFALMSDWFYMAILSLGKVRDALKDPQWISRRLGISIVQARIALERLDRLNLLEEGPSLKQKGPLISVSSDISSTAIHQYHRQVLELAYERLTIPIEKRDYSAVTFVADPSKITSARKKIEEFQEQIMEFLKGSEEGEVYIFSNQLFSCEMPK